MLATFTSDLYESLKEANQLAASMEALRGLERAKIVIEHRNKLAQCRPLKQASRCLSVFCQGYSV
ncbi:hypothetical protein ACL7TT_07095 [Microbulbifer sp. 2304DJ12-6]|uniref:hypothetical protein n=1 Tax=Microbulbifer sp. 2304DJ12-6 TaxID=3233340 RepID=UPI0039B0DD40